MIYKFGDKIINLTNVCYVQFNKNAIVFNFAGETKAIINPDDYEQTRDDIEHHMELQSNHDIKSSSN